MTFLNHQLIDDPSPCHVSVDDQNQFVLTANYHSGKVHVFPVQEDGSLQSPVSEAAHTGKGTARKTRKTAYTLRGVHT
nr:beta-propeller fold lactonase family protein [Bacillus subtilis]